MTLKKVYNYYCIGLAGTVSFILDLLQPNKAEFPLLPIFDE